MVSNGKVRLLLADDDAALQRFLSFQFCRDRVQVTIASTRGEVFEQLDGQVFDVALVSARLIEKNGDSLLPLMHRIQPMLQIIVIADGSSGTTRRVTRRGAFQVVPPDEPDLLASQVLNAHSVRRLQMSYLSG